MTPKSRQARAAWALSERQHGALARRQLIELDFTPDAIRHRVAIGRLHPTPFWGVYSVGRPELSEPGRLMAAVLSCGERAALSHQSAAALWEIRRAPRWPLHVTVPGAARSRRGILVVHRRPAIENDTTRKQGIPVTTPLATLIDITPSLSDRQLQSAINEADKLNLIQAHELPALLAAVQPRPGTKRLRGKAKTHQRTDSDLELALLNIVRKARLPLPETQVRMECGRVDFYWPELGLVVEVDHSKYHRTPLQQAADRRRDQVHLAKGRIPMRFSEADVDEPARVVRALKAVMRRLGAD